ncbi:MAG: TonB-dependent receptor [Lentimicrobium sp.]|uniref:SusC/RagA family TonB-linked outer membrane protein n=1 Tax=Lentimicrobium sp. TaxID=2034841 RepID=UPI0025EBFFD1|nr:TonB-dependent receptor [Lentimicrobium sp.]MCO5258136.1 TonB-dependent receptor [Lentimicrobium sp.]
MKKLLYMLIMFTSLGTYAFAQERTITGTVTDSKDGTTIPGVNVLLKGTSTGTTTDIDGKYILSVPGPAAVLQFSFIGYTTKDITVGGQNTINVALESEAQMLNELVVIGYGTVRKSDLTGAVSSVKSKDLVKITAMNPVQALQGKVTGVQITSPSGAPGASPVVRVRGIGTFNNADPIYVVDGVITDNISFLSSADIASMEVLKDASATAIYGSRGANGVILVTTKSGKKGQIGATFTYSGEIGLQNLAKKIDLLNGREYAIIANRIRPGSYNNVDAVPNTDWQDLIFRSAIITNHQLSASGSTDAVQYYIGVGYFKQDGIVDKSSFERITVKLNNTYNFNNFFRVGNNISLSPYKQRNAPNVTFQAYRALPVLHPYREDDSFSAVPGVGNPLADLAYSNNFSKGIRGVGNVYAEADITKHFTAKSSLSVDGTYSKAESFTPAFAVLNYDGTASMQNNLYSDLYKGQSDNLSLLWENTLNYNRNVGKHSFQGLAGYTMQKITSEYLNLSGEDILRDGSDFWYINGNYVYVKDKIDKLGAINNGVDQNMYYSMLSYLFRINYTYDSRYIFTATFRRDGSSKFAEENRYGNFPAFAVGWNISNEEFMQDIRPISNLKLRASWGKIGNEKIDYSNRFSLTQNLLGVFGLGDISYPAVTYAKSGNPDLKWETTTQADVGLEVGMLSNRFTAEFDYYNRVTSDILIELSTPGHMGNGLGQKVRYNAGEMLNRGFEFNLNWREQIGDFNYGFGILGSTLHNEVLKVGGNSGIDSLLYGGFVSGATTESREGLPIGSFWGYKIDGVFQNQSELDNYPHDSQAGIGDLRRVDVNGDGKFNGLDRTNIGSPIPTFIFGFNVELGYKNFDFSFNIQGQTGNKILNAKEIVRPDAYNYEDHVNNAWNGEGTSNTEPRPSFGGYNYVPSEFYLQDGSFVRLRNVVLGYTIPESLLKRFNIKELRIYVKGDNVFTLTKFTGYTPEIGSSSPIDNGIDSGIYPVSSTYSFGLNLTF